MHRPGYRVMWEPLVSRWALTRDPSVSWIQVEPGGSQSGSYTRLVPGVG